MVLSSFIRKEAMCGVSQSERSSEFVAKFMPMLKAFQEKEPGYLYHVALLVIRNPCFA